MKNLFNYLKEVLTMEKREEEKGNIVNLVYFFLGILFIALAFATKTGRFILSVVYGLGGLFIAVYFAYGIYRNCRQVMEGFAVYKKECKEASSDVADNAIVEPLDEPLEEGSDMVTEQSEIVVTDIATSEKQQMSAEISVCSRDGDTDSRTEERAMSAVEEKSCNAYYFDADALVRKAGSLYLFFLTDDFKVEYLLPTEDAVAVTDEDALEKIMMAEADPNNKQIFVGCTNFIRAKFVVLKKKKDFNNKKLSEMLQKKVKCIM